MVATHAASLFQHMTTIPFGKKNPAIDLDIWKHGSTYVWPENVVARLRLASDIDLRRLSAGSYSGYIPHRFETYTSRMRDKRPTTLLLFHTGRTVVAGSQSMEHTYEGLHRMRLELEASGKQTTVDELERVNMVYSSNLDTPRGINLGQMHAANMSNTEYDPREFPGQKMTDDRLKVIYRFFDTGNLLVMGACDAATIQEAMVHAFEVAAEFPDDDLPDPSSRYEYRQQQKRLACNERVASAIRINNPLLRSRSNTPNPDKT